jgi:hypothetical protein
MPVGTGAETLSNIPASPYVVDPSGFMALTKRNVVTPKRFSLPAAGAFEALQVPQVGVLSKLLVQFVGSLVSTPGAGSVTPTNEWPYNLLRGVQLQLNGANELHAVSGIDYHVLRFVRYPAYDEFIDVFPGYASPSDVGISTPAAIAAGTYDVNLTWEIPLAMDDVSLVGSLFAQASSSNIQLRVQRALDADLFTLAGGATVALSGTIYLQTTTFDVPFAPDGRLITPDLSRLHGLNAVEIPFTAVGENRVPLIRSAGNLARLFLSGESADNVSLSARPAAPASRKIERFSIEYGANKRPLNYLPASTLLAVNNQHYGSVVPYERLVLDTVKENPIRDAILMAGLTELAAVVEVGSSVSVTAGRMRVVQETLF